MLGQHRETQGANFVGHVPIGGHTVGTHDDRINELGRHDGGGSGIGD